MDNPAVNVAIIGGNLMIAVVGVVGNALVIAVVWTTKSMHTTTNYLLANLALADIITMLMSPGLQGTLWNDVVKMPFQNWSQNTKDWICRIFAKNGLIGVFIFVSVHLLTIVAIERYHAMVKPMKTRLRLERENVWKVVVGVWVVSILLNIPIFIDVHFDPNVNMCIGVWTMDTTVWASIYLACFMTLESVIPIVIITTCYVAILKGLFITNSICAETVPTSSGRESKKKLAKLLASVNIAFFICLGPWGGLLIYLGTVEKPQGLPSVYASVNIVIVFVVSATLCVINSAINPILYAFQSSSYRRGFKRLLTCRCLVAGQQEDVSSSLQATNVSQITAEKPPSGEGAGVVLQDL